MVQLQAMKESFPLDRTPKIICLFEAELRMIFPPSTAPPTSLQRIF